jgi:large subunit ribosomal protein L14e
MFEIGRLCVKIAGRDAGKKCVVVDTLDNNYVLIDGQTRRKRCNPLHLEPLSQIIKINKNADHEEIKVEFEKLDLIALDTKPKQKTVRPRVKRKTTEELRTQRKERRKVMEVFKKKPEPQKQKGETELEKKLETNVIDVIPTKIETEKKVIDANPVIEVVDEKIKGEKSGNTFQK